MNTTRPAATVLAALALSLSACASDPDPAPTPLPTVATTSEQPEAPPPATEDHGHGHTAPTEQQKAVALEAARIMSTWNPAKDTTRTAAELRARHLMTEDRAADVEEPERGSGGAEWIAAEQAGATSVPEVRWNDRADVDGVAVVATWTWQKADGTMLAGPARQPVRFYTFQVSEDGKITDYEYQDR